MLDKIEIYPYQRIAEANAEQSFRRSNWLPDIRREEIFARIKGLVTIDNILLGAGAVLMARAFVLGELLPFIFALIAAFGYRQIGRTILLAVFALPGFMSVLQGPALWHNVVAVMILAGVLSTVKIPANKTWWGLPVLTVSIILLSKTIFLLLGEFSFYGEMVTVFEALMTGILTFVFIICNEVFKQRKTVASFSFEEVASFMVLGIGLIMGLNQVQVAGLMVGSIICRLGILLAAFLWGSGTATMVGVMTGIIPSITSSIFAQSLGMYAVSGLLAGIFRQFGRLGVVIGFMLGTLALSLFISETQATVIGMWESAIACLIFVLLPESLQEKAPLTALGGISSSKDHLSGTIKQRWEEQTRNRIENLAGVFDELSSTFTIPMSRSESNQAYLNYLYDEIAHGFCEDCSRYQECWQQDCYQTAQEMMEIFSLAELKNGLDYDKIPPAFRLRCIHGRELVNTVNYLFDNLRLNAYWSNRLGESREIVARQLQGVGQVIRNLAGEIDSGYEADIQLRDKLLRESRRRGLSVREITALRGRGNELYLKVAAEACAGSDECNLKIAPVIAGLIGENLQVEERRCPRLTGKGECQFTLSRSCSYQVVTGSAQSGKEEICGDSFTVAKLKEGKQLIALSDGMGVGEEACRESSAAVRLLEKLLNSGFEPDTVLQTINSVLQLKSNTDMFATLDMILIDLFSAEVDFIKIGSAPSFLKRGKRVGIITSNSLPIGIVDNIEVISEQRSLSPGDIIVLVSDGVVEVNRKQSGEEWICNLLSGLDETDPQIIAELILAGALALCQGIPRDDMTVIAVKLEVNNSYH
ncbi:MAG: stage II sporulation protein E [Syntrophomonadaceae bacterium]